MKSEIKDTIKTLNDLVEILRDGQHGYKTAAEDAKAAELAQMNRIPFGDLVGQRGIARHYGDAELAQDISYGRGE